jgi:hypothetical protein
MPFVKGQSGNPTGRPKEKIFTDALRLAVKREDGDTTKLHRIAERLVAEALAGESWAIQQIADRLDGKPAQAIIGGDDDDPAINLVARIERVIVDVAAKPAKED